MMIVLPSGVYRQGKYPWRWVEDDSLSAMFCPSPLSGLSDAPDCATINDLRETGPVDGSGEKVDPTPKERHWRGCDNCRHGVAVGIATLCGRSGFDQRCCLGLHEPYLFTMWEPVPESNAPEIVGPAQS